MFLVRNNGDLEAVEMWTIK